MWHAISWLAALRWKKILSLHGNMLVQPPIMLGELLSFAKQPVLPRTMLDITRKP